MKFSGEGFAGLMFLTLELSRTPSFEYFQKVLNFPEASDFSFPIENPWWSASLERNPSDLAGGKPRDVLCKVWAGFNQGVFNDISVFHPELSGRFYMNCSQLHILQLNRTEFRYFSLWIKTISLDLTEQLIGSGHLSKKNGKSCYGSGISLPLTNDCWKAIFLLKWSLFRWHVIFQGYSMGNGVVFLKPLRGPFFFYQEIIQQTTDVVIPWKSWQDSHLRFAQGTGTSTILRDLTCLSKNQRCLP